MRKKLFLCAILSGYIQAFADPVPTFYLAGKLTNLKQQQLPLPYKFLLAQPLMTQGLEKYYQRRAIIKKISASQTTNSYSRTIIMLVDKFKSRNNPSLALKKKEALVVELAFIKMNFSILPEQIKKDVLQANVPFGTLLSKSRIQIYPTGRSYFATKCSKKLAALIHCSLKNKVYGRTNTIRQASSKIWLAKVVEILP